MKSSMLLAVLPMALATPVAIARSTGGDDVTCLRAYVSQLCVAIQTGIKELANFLTSVRLCWFEG